MRAKYNLFAFVLLVGGALFLVGCASTSKNLDATNWNLSGYRNEAGKVVDPLVGSVTTADFQAESVSGIAGCNNYSASYQEDGKSIKFSPPRSTRKICADPNGIMSQENNFLTNLESASEYQIKNDQLTLTNSAGEVVLTFSRK